MDLDLLQQQFQDTFHKEAEHIYFTPGRVNLIGEHIDYNGGRVFPCALSFGTYLLIAKRNDDKCSLASLNMPFKAILTTEEYKNRTKEWIDYPLGVINEFSDRGILFKGYDLLFYGNIPNRAGLSSSASVEVVTAIMIDDVMHAGLDRIELVKMSQHAENHFVGMNCGIMDQFAVGMGQKNHAIALDCATLDYDLVSLDITGYKLVITNSNKHHDLVTSDYNLRRRQCEEALHIAQKHFPIDNLCDMTLEQLESIASDYKDEVIYRRALHAVTENIRVTEAIEALRHNDLAMFGKLMNASHKSLKENYEVTGIEMDTLAEEAQKLPGVLGSRITGGGFGGCTVTLIEESQVDNFIHRLDGIYSKKIGLKADFYIADVGNGGEKIY